MYFIVLRSATAAEKARKILSGYKISSTKAFHRCPTTHQQISHSGAHGFRNNRPGLKAPAILQTLTPNGALYPFRLQFLSHISPDSNTVQLCSNLPHLFFLHQPFQKVIGCCIRVRCNDNALNPHNVAFPLLDWHLHNTPIHVRIRFLQEWHLGRTIQHRDNSSLRKLSGQVCLIPIQTFDRECSHAQQFR